MESSQEERPDDEGGMEAIQQPVASAFVPETAITAIGERVERINRVAAKLQVEPVTLRLTGESRVVQDVVRYGNNLPHREIEIAIFGTQPRLAGDWIMLGVVDHREAVAIVRTVPGLAMPEGQRERGPICDHCRAIRDRAETFVLRALDGRVVQVGRQCLGDFLGSFTTDPSAALRWWLKVASALEVVEGEFRSRPVFNVREVVTFAAATVKEFGWCSKTDAQARPGVPATTSLVDWLLFSRDDSPAWVEAKNAVRPHLTPELSVEVESMLTWAREQSSDANDYMLNLRAIAQCEYVGMDKLALVVSLCATYWRSQEREIKRVAEQATRKSGHVGELKERRTGTLTLTAAPREFEGHFGCTYLHEFVDADGFVITWWTSSPATSIAGGWSVGVPRAAKYTVKKHEDYKGFKRTVVTRVKAV